MAIFLNKCSFTVEISFKNASNSNFFFTRPFLKPEKKFTQKKFFGFSPILGDILKQVDRSLLKFCLRLVN